MADFETVRLSITKEEKMEARKLARSRGMTFYGLLSALIRRELADAREEKAQGAGGGEE